MTRKLPWLQTDTNQDSSGSRSTTSSRPRRSRPIVDSSDIEQPPGRQNRRGKRPRAAGKLVIYSFLLNETLISIAREVSPPPLDEPPDERYVVSCGYRCLTTGLNLL